MQTELNPAALVKDTTEATFMADVIETSKKVPVIVDFWAPWCGPCRTLGPALEAAVHKAGGKVRMVKINVDENQTIAAQMRIQSIPAVFAFVDGRPVDGFMGAQSPAQIDEFIRKILSIAGDGGLTEALDAADAMLAEGAVADAAQTYAAILAEEAGNTRALAGLVRAHLALNEIDRARAYLDLVPADKAADPAITAARAQLDLAEAAAGAGEVDELRARVAAAPDDLQARFDLAMAQVGARDEDGAIDTLLDLFGRDREWNDGAARVQLFKLFDSMGPKSAVAQKGRRRLSSMIFA